MINRYKQSKIKHKMMNEKSKNEDVYTENEYLKRSEEIEIDTDNRSKGQRKLRD